MTTSNAEVLISEARVPESLRANLTLFLRLLRRVLRDYDPSLLAVFDELLSRHACVCHVLSSGEHMRGAL